MTLQVFKCCVCIWIGVFSETMLAQTQKVVFSRDFSPAEGLVTPQEKPYRDEAQMNKWVNYSPDLTTVLKNPAMGWMMYEEG